MDWVPSDPLSVQFIADYGTVDYPDRLGAQNGEVQFYSLDGTYLITDKWQVNGWVSYTDTHFDQATIGQAATQPPPSGAVTAAPGQIWSSNLVQTTTAVGLGLRGKPMAKLEIGADLQYQEDKSEFNLLAISGPLPEITVKHATLTLYGTYAVKPNSGVKLQYIYDHYTTNDWAWQLNPFPFFSNGTVVFNESPQNVNFVGVSYYYNWQ
ncbi:MAG TPA: MtrB/PioB family outer membrane beta-barrel protein [Burkholderiales bacterium]|nr:MtrB/PioB family outer membrane beta-barrel protein [Burkholderiales bacterium]